MALQKELEGHQGRWDASVLQILPDNILQSKPNMTPGFVGSTSEGTRDRPVRETSGSRLEEVFVDRSYEFLINKSVHTGLMFGPVAGRFV